MDKWDRRFMNLAEEIASWSSCCRRQEGAIIVQDRRIVATGYNGAPAGVESCVEKKFCIRDERNIPNGSQLQTCYAVPAEQSAISSAARLGCAVKDATMYVTHHPNVHSVKIIINAGIKRVVYMYGYPEEFSVQLLREAGVTVDCFEELGSDEDI